MSRSNLSFQVRPRYTPGSPGLVDEETALRVASQEKENYEVAREGVYGDGFKELAEKMGMGGIVERREERAGGWEVTDLITGRMFRRAVIKASKLQPQDLVTEIQSGPEAGRWDPHLPAKVLSVAHVTRPSKVIARWEPMVGLSFQFDPSDLIKVEREAKEV